MVYAPVLLDVATAFELATFMVTPSKAFPFASRTQPFIVSFCAKTLKDK